MKRKLTISTFLMLLLTLPAFRTYAQYGSQFQNAGFEQWANYGSSNSSYEPINWHSGMSASGSFAGFLSQQIDESEYVRPGSDGMKSAKIWPNSVLGITANGNICNGRMNAGSMSATGSGNYNYTQRSDSDFNTPIETVPDSLSVWVCFRCADASQNAQLHAAVHGNADYRFLADGGEEPMDMLVASAHLSFLRTSNVNAPLVWRRLSVPFVHDGVCNDPQYILLTMTTNEVPGQGGTSDDLYIDDILLIYNPTLTTEPLASQFFDLGENIDIPFSLVGTMSANNLNIDDNQVIAQISDSQGNFDYPIELARITTDVSGTIHAVIPDNLPLGEHYRVRVVSTNYPIIAEDNGQDLTIRSNASLFHVELMANPIDGGTVTGGGDYTENAMVTVKAFPADDYHFISWTENGEIVSNQCEYSFAVVADRNLVAEFAVGNSIQDASQVEIDLFPNPAKDFVRLQSDVEIESYELIDFVGNRIEVRSVCSSDFSIRVADYPSGIYFIKVVTKNSVSIRRIIIL